MLNGVLPPLLCLSSRNKPRSKLPKCFLPIGWHFLQKIERIHEGINISVVTSTGELRVYFKQILKTWAGELSRDSAGRAHFTGLRRSSKLKRAQLKLFSLGGTFRLSWASQPIASVSVNDLWKGRMRHRDTKLERFLHKNQHNQRKLLNFENWINGGLRSLRKSEF